MSRPSATSPRRPAPLSDADLLDPVDAYDRLAPAYPRIARSRAAYLEGIDRILLAEIVAGSRSLLDVGAGTGERSVRLARAAGLDAVTIVEPSAAMRSACPPSATVWPIRAEELSSRNGHYDVITCLWNVLGHVFPETARIEVLRQFARLRAPNGRIFVDVNHRYNARHYGGLKTTLRWLHDRLSPAVANGDVRVCWDIEGSVCATSGHVFTRREFERLVARAGLSIDRCFVVDYATGQLCRQAWQGHLLYCLR